MDCWVKKHSIRNIHFITNNENWKYDQFYLLFWQNLIAECVPKELEHRVCIPRACLSLPSESRSTHIHALCVCTPLAAVCWCQRNNSIKSYRICSALTGHAAALSLSMPPRMQSSPRRRLFACSACECSATAKYMAGDARIFISLTVPCGSYIQCNKARINARVCANSAGRGA